MQHIPGISHPQDIVSYLKRILQKKIAFVKQKLNNETVQKMLLFAAILGLLLLAANLDVIL